MRRFLFSGHGRLDRLGYLFALFGAAVLFVAPVALLLGVRAVDAGRLADPETIRQAIMVLGVVCWLLVLWIYCAVTARRLHDMDRSGWLTILALFPVVGLGGMTALLLFAPGSPGKNRHGERWL